MDLRTYYYGLDAAEREAFAHRAETTVGYIQCHLITRRKIPRPNSMRKLAAASENRITLDDLLAYFYKANHHSPESQFRPDLPQDLKSLRGRMWTLATQLASWVPIQRL